MKLIAQLPLPTFNISPRRITRRTIGMLGELTAQMLFEESGYQVCRAPRNHGDLKVVNPSTGETHYIEVKTARRSKDKKWRFPLIPGGNAYTDHRKADMVLLLAVLNSERVIPFLVPKFELEHQHQACICSYPLTYAGRLRKYRQHERLSL